MGRYSPAFNRVSDPALCGGHCSHAKPELQKGGVAGARTQRREARGGPSAGPLQYDWLPCTCHPDDWPYSSQLHTPHGEKDH
ncbi:Hypothetical predicted protein [Marmota monax]|uniref:Uncharacterized protein n=1 Tax=Marmota monax TaxID=9995 RepID=A0A5E4B9Z6_MARMO|nr:hypothetical protein GHT09_011803 [Marmota monax]VTJ66478.1 Hypothetical predicted protein [Marmota monax]